MRIREMDIEFYRNFSDIMENKCEPGWQYDEMKFCGVKFSSAKRARAYDKSHQRFRDFERESEEIIALLGLDADHTVLDMGCGTGAFAIHAAKHLKKIYAVDVSKAMLRRARRKAKKANLDNIEFYHGGFLTYEHKAEPVDAIVSSRVLHHLPDFWKLIGLKRLAQMLKTNGRLYLHDVVFSFDITNYESSIKGFIESMTEKLGLQSREVLKIHFRQEYSTCGWIMQGLLERAGFMIDKADYKDDFKAAYLCTKKSESMLNEDLKNISVKGQHWQQLLKRLRDKRRNVKYYESQRNGH
ncbi:MAG: methyltransferase domain-containing protein [Phycisphaerales bacterium]|jgi:ubiquinone/menaquinone biosynthesis C-methylase UbiE